MVILQVNLRDANGCVSRLPAQAIPGRGTAPSTEPVTSPENVAGGSAPGIAVKAEAWTRVCVYSSAPSLKGLRIGSDAAIVWTLANLPAGQRWVDSRVVRMPGTNAWLYGSANADVPHCAESIAQV